MRRKEEEERKTNQNLERKGEILSSFRNGRGGERRTSGAVDGMSQSCSLAILFTIFLRQRKLGREESKRIRRVFTFEEGKEVPGHECDHFQPSSRLNTLYDLSAYQKVQSNNNGTKNQSRKSQSVGESVKLHQKRLSLYSFRILGIFIFTILQDSI